MLRAVPWTRLVTATALAPAVVVGVAGPAGADDPELVEMCTTDALTHEEMEEGVLSDVSCQWVDPEEFSLQSLSSILATHHDGFSGLGPTLTVYGDDCDGGVAFGSSDPWNDRISSTQHVTCGAIKHYLHSNYSGSMQLSEGSFPWITNMNMTLNDNVSSIIYGD